MVDNTKEKVIHYQTESEEKCMAEMVRQKTKTYDLVYISIFVVLIAICSWISIPLTVPVTLQTFGVFMAVLAEKEEPWRYWSIFSWEPWAFRSFPDLQAVSA